MIRSYNFTGRKKILRENMRIVLKRSTGKPPEFEAALGFDTNEFEAGAKVYIEAYKGPSFQRFEVGEISSELTFNGVLDRFHSDSHVLFRIKIVDESESAGKLLGWADRINFVSKEENAARSRCILPVEPADLGDRIWKLEWESDDPILQVNREIREPRDMKTIVASDKDFLALAYPEILSEVYRHILIDSTGYDREEDPSGWLSFALVRLGIEIPPPDFDADTDDREQAIEDITQWINEVILAFCEENGIRSAYNEFKEETFGNG